MHILLTSLSTVPVNQILKFMHKTEGKSARSRLLASLSHKVKSSIAGGALKLHNSVHNSEELDLQCVKICLYARWYMQRELMWDITNPRQGRGKFHRESRVACYQPEVVGRGWTLSPEVAALEWFEFTRLKPQPWESDTLKKTVL